MPEAIRQETKGVCQRRDGEGRDAGEGKETGDDVGWANGIDCITLPFLSLCVTKLYLRLNIVRM
jgi:hypothetical protein